MLSAVILSGAMMAAGACEGPFDMGAGRIGPFQLGSIEQITDGNLPYGREQFMDDGGDHYSYVVTVCPGVTVQAFVNVGETTIYELSTTSSAFVTAQGAHVGMTVAQLKQVYPRGEFVYGTADGYYATYVTRTEVYFRIGMDGIPEDCFSYSLDDCEARFEHMKSVSADIRR